MERLPGVLQSGTAFHKYLDLLYGNTQPPRNVSIKVDELTPLIFSLSILVEPKRRLQRY